VSASAAGDDWGRYELRINGLLGPLLLGTLPHAAASLEPRNTLVVTRGREGQDLLDVLQALADRGVQIESVREIPDADGGEDPE
jgi:hypothetical protein